MLAALATTAVLFSVVCSQRSVLARCLSVAPLRYVGRISYGMYLWHFPLFIYLDHARTGLSGYPLFAVRVAVTLVVATGSFYGWSDQSGRAHLLTGWRTWAITPLAVLGTAAALVAATSVPAVAAKAPAPPSRSALDTGPPVRALVVGDSTALTLDIGLNEYARDYDVEPFNGGILGCGVTDGAEYQEKGVDAPMAVQCRGAPPRTQWPALWKADIAKDHPNVVMILAGRWEVSNRTYDGHWTNIENPTYAAYVQHQLRYAVQVAGSGGAAVVLMTAPCYDTGEQPDGQPWPEDSRTRLDIYNGIVRRVAAATPGTVAPELQRDGVPGRALRGIHGRPAGAPWRRHPLHLHRRKCLRAQDLAVHREHSGAGRWITDRPPSIHGCGGSQGVTRRGSLSPKRSEDVIRSLDHARRATSWATTRRPVSPVRRAQPPPR